MNKRCAVFGQGMQESGKTMNVYCVQYSVVSPVGALHCRTVYLRADSLDELLDELEKEAATHEYSETARVTSIKLEFRLNNVAA